MCHVPCAIERRLSEWRRGVSDARLRDLERRWVETGSPYDGAAFLLERVRSGAMSREQLNTAAYCGDATASIAVGGVTPPGEFVEWYCGLSELGHVVAARAEAAIARLLISQCGPAMDDVTRAIDLLDAWLEDPTPENADRAYAAGQYAGEQVPSFPTQELRQAIWTTAGIAMTPTAIRLGRITWRRECYDTAVRALQVLPSDALRRGCEAALLSWSLAAKG